MSKSNKKKPIGHHLKYDRGEQRDHFFERVESVFAALHKPDAYRMIPSNELDLIYKLRFLPFRIAAAPGEQIPEEVLRKMRPLFADILKHQNVSLTKNGPKIPLADHHSTATLLRIYLQQLQDHKFRSAAELKKVLAEFISYDEGTDEANDKIAESMSVIGLEHNDLGSRLYWAEWKMTPRPFDPFGFDHAILIHSHVPEKKHFTFDGIPRPAVKLCLAFPSPDGVKPVTVKRSDLGLSSGNGDDLLDVYVQMHALKRLSERMDCVDASMLHAQLCVSIAALNARCEEDGSFMIEYRLDGTKAGYLIAEVNDNALVIRTFLFVTNGGTPEGKKLQEISGLGKLDKQYLTIDKVSTFVASDIGSNKELESLFQEAGCGCLFDLSRKVAGITSRKDLTSTLPILIKYFGLDGKRDFMVPDRMDKIREKFAG